MQTLFAHDKDTNQAANSTAHTPASALHHRSCYSAPKTDDFSKADQMYQRCKQLHPQFYFNNLGVLELRKGNLEQAKSNFMQGAKISGFLFEPCYNAAYLMFKRGEF